MDNTSLIFSRLRLLGWLLPFIQLLTVTSLTPSLPASHFCLTPLDFNTSFNSMLLRKIKVYLRQGKYLFFNRKCFLHLKPLYLHLKIGRLAATNCALTFILLFMLTTKNALFFRKQFKSERSGGYQELDFVGSLYKKDRRITEGFASLTLGNREDIGKYLSTVALNVAADDQAIYELIQNADDSQSGLFSVSYNEQYLLCINNGRYFSHKDMAAIINVAGNYKDGEDIGTFGIGFKILHRLVGADDGREAIVNDYAGPVIFSWNRFEHFQAFAKGEDIEVNQDREVNWAAPWLVKILNTCFPCHLNEVVRLNDYQTKASRFDAAELQEMRSFLHTALKDANIAARKTLPHGSIFFLKLGPGKHKFLTEGIEKIKSGLSYSFKFLNHLEKIYINGEEIAAQSVESYTGTYPAGSPDFLQVNPKNKNRDIRFTFAFYRNYKDAAPLRNGYVPNLYTFFSMDEEKNGFSFILHCNAFDMNNDRRKLQANSQINEQLLPLIARDVIAFTEQQKGKSLYNWLYSALLLSQEPVAKEHINKYLFAHFKAFLRGHIPTKQGYAAEPAGVRISTTTLNVHPDELGCPEISWFYWHQERTDHLLLQEARKPEKLGLENWGITDLLLHAIHKGQLSLVNAWVQRTEQENTQVLAEERRQREASPDARTERKQRPYYTLLWEMDKQVSRINFEVLSQIKLFRFSDQQFYSVQEAGTSPELILNYSRTYDVRFELQALGFKTSYLNLAEQANLNDQVRAQTSDLSLFLRIREKTKDNLLRKDQKHRLFQALAVLEHVGPERLGSLELYKDSSGKVKPLKNMLKSQQQLPNWLEPYRIDHLEYLPELDTYLLAEKDIYRELILPNWETIINTKLNLNEFYQQVKYYYGLDDQHPALKDQAFVFINPGLGFLTGAEVFYNKNLAAVTAYGELQEALQLIFSLPIPFRPLLNYFKEQPFKLENQKLLEMPPSAEHTVSLDALKSLLAFCQLNEELFFQHYVIAGHEDQFRLLPRTNARIQFHTPFRELRGFIRSQLAEHCIDLPVALDNYRESPGIIQGEALYNLILERVDIDEHIPALTELIHYDLPRQKLLLGLRDLVFDLTAQLDRDTLAVKLIMMACSYLAEEHYPVFREKIAIAAGGQRFKLRDIPPFSDKVTVQGQTLQLSEILTDSYQNSAYLSQLLDQLLALGLPQAKLYELFGMADEPDPETIYRLLKAKTILLSNVQQLAFVLLYSQETAADLSAFEVTTLAGNFSLNYPYYVEEHLFLSKEAVLGPVYQQIGTLVDLPFTYGEDHQLIRAPYLEDGEFVAPYLETALDDAQKTALLHHLFGLYQTDPKTFAGADWSQIAETETKTLLGFEPACTVYPDDHTLPEERLPAFARDWALNDILRTEFLMAMGVWTTGSTLNALRAALAGTGEFNGARIAQEVKFKDERLLFNTLRLIRTSDWQLDEEAGMPLLSEMVRVINTFRQKEPKLQIVYAYDTDALEDAPEWQADYYEHWKTELEEKFLIYCHDGPLPQRITVNGIPDHVFRRFNRGDAMIDEENRIYINQHADIKAALSTLIAGDNDFDAESLLRLYQSKDQNSQQADQVQELQDEISRLRARITQLENTGGTAAYSATVSDHDDYHQVIKEASEQYLYQALQTEFPNHEVHWLNRDPATGLFRESWADHDFEVRDRSGNIISYIDCKGTPRSKQTFYLTSNEWHFSLRCKQQEENYCIYRVFQADTQPEHLCIDDPHEWIAAGRLVPYLFATETIRGDRVFLTII